MDLWYIANNSRGTLPERYQGMNTVNIAEEMGVACHAVRADYTLPRSKEDLILRGFGIDNHPDYPYRVELKGFPVRFEHDEENLKTWIKTPVGEIFTHIKTSQEMIKDGISLPFIMSYPIRSKDDFEAVARIFEHLKVIRTPENYRSFKKRIGNHGLAIANGMPVASPVHFMLHDLVAMDNFFYLYMDSREELYSMAKRMEPFFNDVLDAVLDSDCEAFLWGSNYDQNTTYPGFFNQEIKPWIDKVGRKAEAVGKYALCHTDGENRELLDCYRNSAFHVAESVCTAPMTKLTLREFRDGVGNNITTWGGIPAISLLRSSMNDSEFDTYIAELFKDLGSGSRLILGVSDNVPPEMSFERMQEIKRRIQAFGSVQV